MRHLPHGFLLAALLVSCGQQSASTSSLSLVNGQLAQASEYPATVVYLMPDGGLCTATKVSKRFFLTAAHCLATANGRVKANLGQSAVIKASNFPKRNVNDTSMWHSNRIKRILLNPDFATSCAASGADCSNALSSSFLPPPDIALIEFYNDLPAQWPEAVIDRSPVWTDDEVTVVGYGCENGVYQPDTPDERKKFGHTWVVPKDEVNKPQALVTATNLDLFDSRFFLTPGAHYDYQSTKLNVSICPGDSGGPVYRKGTNVIVGVHADYTFFDANDGYTWVNLHTRLADVNGRNPNITLWLESNLPAAAFTTSSDF